MRQAIILVFAIFALGIVAAGEVGPKAITLVAMGAISVMALMIAATFFWLWQMRATPLAFGMALSWAGTGASFGWFWLQTIIRSTEWGIEAAALFMALSLVISGAILHFSAIQWSLGLGRFAFVWPVAIAFSLSICLAVPQLP